MRSKYSFSRLFWLWHSPVYHYAVIAGSGAGFGAACANSAGMSACLSKLDIKSIFDLSF